MAFEIVIIFKRVIFVRPKRALPLYSATSKVHEAEYLSLVAEWLKHTQPQMPQIDYHILQAIRYFFPFG